jgi:uncharacterized membrane protein YedE/YeeE
MDFLAKPWPWYIVGPLIGLTVPLLLVLGNKNLGVSSTLRQLATACLPARAGTGSYNWKNDQWNLFFVSGILIGGWLGGVVVANPAAVAISVSTKAYLQSLGVTDFTGLMPVEFFTLPALLTFRGVLLMLGGGFLVGFGTRYARGCTSGHGILGLSALQWPSLIATASFFLGGILFSKFILPLIVAL